MASMWGDGLLISLFMIISQCTPKDQAVYLKYTQFLSSITPQ